MHAQGTRTGVPPHMLFTGSTELNIDAKGRLSVPSRYRSQLTESDNTDANQKDQPKQKQIWITLPWNDGSIRLYTESTFTELASQWTPITTDLFEILPDIEIGGTSNDFVGSSTRYGINE